MADRAAKDALFGEFAAVGKVLGNPARLELLDLLAQGPRSVDELAAAAGLGVSTCSAHLQTLRAAGLVQSRRDGKRIFYSLAGDDVAVLWDTLRRVAQRHRPHTELARRAYLGPDDTPRPSAPRNCCTASRPARWSCSTCAPRPNTPPGTCPARCTCHSTS
ncbi:hypothetical protein AIIKEEIJ_01135 [Rhodococcus sp. YH1]|nr:hypothetical protein [Rhodococcus sp. YH1]